MNQHLHSPTKLTEFARDFEEEPDTFLGRMVNKIQNVYNHSYNAVNDMPANNQPTASKSIFYAKPDDELNNGNNSGNNLNSAASVAKAQPPKTLAVQTAYERHSSTASSSTSTLTTTDETSSSSGGNAELYEATDVMPIEEGRTMLNVLKRISNITASKNSNLREYKDTDLQRFWMPDSKAKECYDCAQKFSTFRRKHHCRLCGQIFCSKCCNQVVSGKIIKCSGDLKVCNYCSKIVLSYLKSPNIADDLHSDLQALQQNLTSRFENQEDVENLRSLPIPASLPRKISVGYQEERLATHYQSNSLSLDDRKNILQQSNSLISLHEEMQCSLPTQNCGLDLIEYLNTNNKSSNKIQALAILNAMLSAGFLQPIVPDSEQIDFDETLHYKFVDLERPNTMETIDTSHFADISNVSSPQFDASSEPQPPKSIDTSLGFESLQDIEMKTSLRSSKLLESYCDHEDQLLSQMLRTFHLDLRWAKVLAPLCCGAANHFKPEYCSNEFMDIRNYINFKKVPGGKRSSCRIVGGVVFTKNVAHKDMATRVESPRILLLQCPIVYERVAGKFVSISTVLLQEKEYLRNVCERIMSFEPNVVLVHQNVAGIAQEMLRSKGITLVLNVKYSVLERLARTLQCDILTSIESNITKPRLGLCNAFYTQNFDDGNDSSKTLMFFENLTNPRGYTCLLRGGSDKELAKVKKVASFLVYARYNWLLEMSFLLDEFVEPLLPKPPIFDSKEPSPDDDTCNDGDNEPQLRSKRIIIERKTEEKILTAVAENVSDFTDPLRSTDIHDNNNSIIPLTVEMRYDNRFRHGVSSTILSISPFLTFPLPYLETEQGRKCALRSLFPNELYYSKLWSNTNSISNINMERNDNNEVNNTNIINESTLNSPHQFLKLKIAAPIDNRNLQTLLAEFRSYGGRYPKRKELFKLLKRRKTTQKLPPKICDEQNYKDALDLENHQHLPVLFCSLYYNPKSASSFCAPPTLLDMKFYGQEDIMLGQFLHRYCFRLSSICPLCNLPQLRHIRKYVHSMGCVQVFLTEDNNETDPNSIYFTAWCTICNEVTATVPLSETSKCLSFAKYLELRFHGHAYKRCSLDDYQNADNQDINMKTKCQHSLHRDYVHYFTYRGVGAKFQYQPIDIWEIGLSPLTIPLCPPKDIKHFEILDDVKNFSMKGLEVYTRIHERIADFATEDENSPIVGNLKALLSADQFNFKQYIEIVQTLLIDQNVNVFDIRDALLMSKRVLAQSIEQWEPRLHEVASAQKLAIKQQHETGHIVDAGTICTEDLRTDGNEISPTSSELPRVSATTSTTITTSQSNEQQHEMKNNNETHTFIEKKSSTDQILNSIPDKKSIKKMLIDWLPSNTNPSLLQSPFTTQEHLTIPLGAFPILVQDNDHSSIIAYSLTSNEYKRLISNMDNCMLGGNNVTGQSNIDNAGNVDGVGNTSPNSKRKMHESSQDSDEGLKDNININTNTNNHLTITFQDSLAQFACKIYFAKEFDQMRAKTLKPPNMCKSQFKELERSKKREEIKVSQSKNGPEIELIRKPSDAGCNIKSQNDEKPISLDENAQQLYEMEEVRNFLARSLSSSIQWEARGGKSGSRFCKTLDDRFVLKEMTKQDVAFFESFAPKYFEYINNCQKNNEPTLLAKIFGVFEVTIKRKHSSQDKSLLVMENLCYNCDIKNKFDLKGSERNRLADPTNQQGEIVLLDENLLQMSWSKPLYILPHSKIILKKAIDRDASFLEKNRVMDYSLLVGLNEKKNTLVLGIIDYIRAYTIEKKLESFVKETVKRGTPPTVISPQRYKQRFTDAMDRYFNMVPDRWEGLMKLS